MQNRSTGTTVSVRNPFVFHVRVRIGDIDEAVPLGDLLAMYRFKAAVKARDWFNERIRRITNTGVVLRLTSAEDYRRMTEFREDKAHRLVFPRIMYHVSEQSKTVRGAKEAAALLRAGYDYRPVFSEPDVAPKQIAALQGSLRTANDLSNSLNTSLQESRFEITKLRLEVTNIKRELREANERMAVATEAPACR